VATIVDDVRIAATSVADVAAAAGYRLDFTPGSLWEVERFLDENVTAAGEPRPGGLLSKDLGSRVFALGAYVGEVIRRAVGGEWVSDESLDADLTVTLKTTEGTLLWPNQQVMKRIMNGRRDSVVDYANALGIDVGLATH
jgi:hypothetical protein